MHYQPTDRPTDQPTDTASYRGALSHLKDLEETLSISFAYCSSIVTLKKNFLNVLFWRHGWNSCRSLVHSLTIKSISWYLQRLRVIPWLDHYHVGIYFAPYRLKREWFIETLNDIVIPGRVNLVLPFRQPNKPVYALYTHWLTSNLASWIKG